MLAAKSRTQNITRLFSCAGVAGFVNQTCVATRHRSAGHREARGLEQLASGTGADEAIDVKRAECEYEGVDRAEDHERDRRRAGRQEWRHGIRGSQHAMDPPGLGADYS